MSKWIRNYKPTEIDSDEWGNILVLLDNGQKAVYHWEDYNNQYATDGTAWMHLPQSDIPKSVSLTIEVGDRSYTIENNGFTIEVHDSREPMGQPTCFESTDTITGILEAVDAILQVELNDDVDCGREDDLDELMTEDAIDIAIYKKNMDRAVSIAESMTGVPPHVPKKPWNKKK